MRRRGFGAQVEGLTLESSRRAGRVKVHRGSPAEGTWRENRKVLGASILPTK